MSVIADWRAKRAAPMGSDPLVERPKYWFAAKRYGWGWGLPLCWQGWVVMGVWLAVLVPLVILLEEPARGTAVLLESVVLVAKRSSLARRSLEGRTSAVAVGRKLAARANLRSG